MCLAAEDLVKLAHRCLDFGITRQRAAAREPQAPRGLDLRRAVVAQALIDDKARRFLGH